MAKAGVDVWAIQLLGRWGSSAVLGYIREVPLELAATWAARAARTMTLDEVVRQRSLALASSSSSRPPSSTPRASSSSSSTTGASSTVVPEVMVEALSEAIRAEEVAALPMSACRFLASPSGKWHRLSHRGLSGAALGWSAACGWAFAGSLASLADELPAALCHKWFCARCFPEHRALLKRGA